MKTLGRHLLVEYHGCDHATLDDLERLEQTMRRAASAAGATIVASVFHPFTPQGLSGVIVIEESHLSIHTWPELGYAAVDFYTCGDCVPQRAHEVLRAALGAERSEVVVIKRGLDQPGPSIALERVEVQGPVHETRPMTTTKVDHEDHAEATMMASGVGGV